MKWTAREIRAEDIDRIRPRNPQSVSPERRRYFHEILADPECYDGFTVEIETGEILGMGLMYLPPASPGVGVVCVYATDLFPKYPLAVMKACRECLEVMIERNGIDTLAAWGAKADPALPRWFEAWGFERFARPVNSPAGLDGQELYRKELRNG